MLYTNDLMVSLVIAGSFIVIVLSVISIWAFCSIIGINRHLKDFVDLEYKKYKESKDGANTVSSEPRPDRPE